MSRLKVDWVACDGHGLCADLLPELIDLDEWGYPLIAPGEVPDGLERAARTAIAACPALALRVRHPAPSVRAETRSSSTGTHQMRRAVGPVTYRRVP